MNDIDKTYDALMRTSFKTVVNQIYDADKHGSYTFNRMNAEGIWKVSESFEYICIRNGWTVENFNEVLNREFNGKS